MFGVLLASCATKICSLGNMNVGQTMIVSISQMNLFGPKCDSCLPVTDAYSVHRP